MNAAIEHKLKEIFAIELADISIKLEQANKENKRLLELLDKCRQFDMKRDEILKQLLNNSQFRIYCDSITNNQITHD